MNADDAKERHSREEIVRKLRDADAMLNAVMDLAAVLQALEVSESSYLREKTITARRDDEQALVKRMLELARERPRFGYRRIATLLRQEGFRASATRVLRRWRKDRLKVPKKTRRRRSLGMIAASVVARPAEAPNDVWC